MTSEASPKTGYWLLATGFWLDKENQYSITLKNFVFLTKLLIDVMGCLGCKL